MVKGKKGGSYIKDANYVYVKKSGKPPTPVGRLGKDLLKKIQGYVPNANTWAVTESKHNPRIPRKKGQPAGSKKHSDLYTDENPKGTIKGLGFKDVETARASVRKIENSGKTHAHKIQAAIAMEQRAKVMKKTAEAAVYRKYIEKMKKITKKRNETVKSFKEMFDNAPYGEWGTEELINKYKNETPGETVILKRKDNIEEAGLWANIHKRRKSGKRMRKPGEKGAPTKKAFKSASEDVDEGIINIRNEIETIKQRLQKASKDKQKQEVARLQKTLKSLENKKKKLLRRWKQKMYKVLWFFFII